MNMDEALGIEVGIEDAANTAAFLAKIFPDGSDAEALELAKIVSIMVRDLSTSTLIKLMNAGMSAERAHKIINAGVGGFLEASEKSRTVTILNSFREQKRA